MYYVYMVRCSDDSLYTGIAKSLEKRMKEHYFKDKNAANYTKSHPVVSLESVWCAMDRSSASKLEYQIKKFSKSKKEELIQGSIELAGYEKYQHENLTYYINKKEL